MTDYILVSTMALAFLAVIWSRDEALNLVVKLLLLVLAAWGAFEYGVSAGYLPRVH
jgi:hypothetical protein